jgi:hypothetical protein
VGKLQGLECSAADHSPKCKVDLQGVRHLRPPHALCLKLSGTPPQWHISGDDLGRFKILQRIITAKEELG